MNNVESTLFDQIDTVHDGPLKANELDFYALLRRQAGQGRLFFNQRRAVIFDVEALGTLRQQLIDTLGQELTMGVLTRFGYRHGHNDAKTLGENFDWDTETDWLAAGPTIHTLEGIVHVTPEKIEFDRDTGDFHMCGIWLNSYEAEEHLKRYGPGHHPVCWTLTGYASGYTSSFFGQELLAIETECVGKGDSRCYWEIRPVDDWDLEAQPYLAALEQVDLSGQIYKANQQLQKQTHQLTLLNQMSANLNQAATVDDVFNIAAAKVNSIISGSRTSVALLNQAGNEFEIFALDGVKGAIPVGAKLPFEDTAIGQAIRENRLINTPDIANSQYLDQQQLAKQGLQSTMTVPLIAGGHPIGTLNVGSKDLRAYDPHDESVMLQMASLLASAVENRRLFEQTQSRAAALEENTAFLDSIIENIPTMIFVKEAEDLRFVRWNKAGEDLVGFKREDLIGKNDYDFFPKKEADFFTTKDREVLAGGQLVDIPEEPIQTAGGDTRLLHTRKVPVLGADGKPKYLLGISEDITQQQASQLELQKFRMGIERSADAVFLTDVDGTITYINNAFTEVYGYSRAEAIGQTPRIIKSGLMPQEQYKHFWDTLLSGNPISGEFVNKTKDGKLVYIAGSNNPILDDNGRVIGFLSLNRDISRQKAQQQLLDKRATELEAVAQVGTAAATILDIPVLLQNVADLTKENFNLYHAHIYLLDEAGQTLNLAAGAGDVGRTMVNQHWSIPFDKKNSLVARAARIRKGVIANDVRNESGYFQNPMLPHTRSELAVPIISGEKLVGVLDVQSDTVDHFTNEDVRIQTTLATQVAVALQNVSLFTQTQAALTETENLYDASRRIIATDDLQEIVAAIAESGPVSSVDRAMLIDFERSAADDVEALEVVANWHDGAGPKPDPIGTRYNRSLFSTFRFLLNPDPVFFDDIQHDSRVGRTTQDYFQQLNVKSMAVLPLWVGSRQLGALMLESAKLHHFTEREIQPYVTLAGQIAVAIENRRLLDETNRALAEAEAAQRRYTLQTWESYRTKSIARSYEHVRAELSLLDNENLPADKQTITVTAVPNVPNTDMAEENSRQLVAGSPQSSLVVPLTVRGEVIGVFGLEETDKAKEWSPEEIALVEAIAEQISQAAENIRLLDDSQQRAARERRVNEIGDKIQGAQSLEEALQIAVKEVGLSLQAPQTKVQLSVE